MYGLKKQADLGFLLNRQLQLVSVGRYMVNFSFDGEVGISVRSRFSCVASGLNVEWTPNNPKSAAAALDLLHCSIAAFTGNEDGTLALEFSNGVHVVIRDDDPAYEAYTITAPGIQIIV